MLCLAVAAGASMITPGTLEIMERFQISETAALLGLSVYVLGLALGPVLAAPVSETRYVEKWNLPFRYLLCLSQILIFRAPPMQTT